MGKTSTIRVHQEGVRAARGLVGLEKARTQAPTTEPDVIACVLVNAFEAGKKKGVDE